MGHDHHALRADVGSERREQAGVEPLGTRPGVGQRRLALDALAEGADLGDEVGPARGQPHELRPAPIDHPGQARAVADQVLDERGALGQQALDLRQRHRLHRHQRRLLGALAAHAVEERAVVALGGLEEPPRHRAVAALRGERPRLAQPGAQPRLLLHELPRPALGQHGLRPQEVEEGPRARALGEGEGLGGPAELHGAPHRAVIDLLLVLDVAAAEGRLLEGRAQVLEQRRALPEGGERLLVPAGAVEAPAGAGVEPHEERRVVEPRGDRPAFLEACQGRRVVAAALRDPAERQDRVERQLVVAQLPGEAERPLQKRLGGGRVAGAPVRVADERQGPPEIGAAVAPRLVEGRVGVQRADEPLEGLDRLAALPDRGRVVGLGQRHLREPAREDGRPEQPAPRLLERRRERGALLLEAPGRGPVAGHPVDVAHREVRVGETGQHVVVPPLRPEQLDRARAGLEAPLEEAERAGGPHGRHVGLGRLEGEAAPLEVGGLALVEGERLAPLPALDRGVDRLQAEPEPALAAGRRVAQELGRDPARADGVPDEALLDFLDDERELRRVPDLGRAERVAPAEAEGLEPPGRRPDLLPGLHLPGPLDVPEAPPPLVVVVGVAALPHPADLERPLKHPGVRVGDEALVVPAQRGHPVARGLVVDEDVHLVGDPVDGPAAPLALVEDDPGRRPLLARLVGRARDPVRARRREGEVGPRGSRARRGRRAAGESETKPERADRSHRRVS